MTGTLSEAAIGQPPPPLPGSMPAPVGATGAAPRRRFSWVFLGLFLIAGSILAFVFWTASQNDRVPVLVAGNDIAAGAVIERADVKLVAVGAEPGVDLLVRDDQALVVGARARVDIPADTPLLAQMVVPEDLIPPGLDVVGAVLDAGEFPASNLAIGDGVFLLRVGSEGFADEEAVELGAAVIWAIEPLISQSEPRVFLSLLVPEENRLVVADAAGQDRLRISLVGGEP